MNTTDILDAIRTSIDYGEIADAIRSHVSSPAAVDGGRALTEQDTRALAEALRLVTVQFGRALVQLRTAQDDLARVIGERDEARKALYRARRDIAGT